LKEAKDARGRNLQVTRVPLPKPQFYTSQEADSIEGGARSVGERLAASYLNFYIANGAVIVPGFGLPGDDGRAREIIQKAFPERKVVQLQVGRQLALGGGNVHCITQQQPRLQ
jgi:agmatine deiminase